MTDLLIDGQRLPRGVGLELVSDPARGRTGYWTDQHGTRTARLRCGTRVEADGRLIHLEGYDVWVAEQLGITTTGDLPNGPTS